MYQLLKILNARQLRIEVPAFAISFITAEFFFKFGSFTAEAIAFLGMWYVLGLAISKVVK